jgi:group I intron endonuclease
MEWTIYLITNKDNGKKYVGLTLKTIAKRWKEHCWWAFNKPKKDNRVLSCALRKYGAELFLIEKIDSAATLNEANQKEKEWIAKLKTFGEGYNMTEGGDGIVGLRGERHGMWGKGHLVSGENNPMYGRKGEKHPMYGRHHTDETRKKLSDAWAQSPERLEQFIKWSTNRVVTEETRKKIGNVSRGRRQSVDQIAKRVAKLTGDKHPNAKTYRVTSPDGSQQLVKSLSHFCKEQGLNIQSVSNTVKRGTLIISGPHKGWMAQLV